jgi:hypothetical protein
LIGGVVLACFASACFSLGIAMQALEARRIPESHSLRLSLLVVLARRPRWLAGTAIASVGWPLHVAALTLAPLSAVQPALASGLIVLLWLGRRYLDEPVGARELLAIGAIVAGITGVALVAPSESTSHAGADRIVPALAALILLATLPFALSRETARTSRFLPLGAGCAFAATGIISKLVADALSGPDLLALWGWATLTGLIAGLGFLNETSALQSRPATHVAPVVFVVQISVPVLLAPLLSGESWAGTPGGGLVLVGFLVLVAAGAALLGTSRAVAGFVASRGEAAA